MAHYFSTMVHNPPNKGLMPRDFVRELRDDALYDAIDIYNHIDKMELMESYLAHIPQLGV